MKWAGVIVIGAVALAAGVSASTGERRTSTPVPPEIHKIKHVVMIMQENRSFDHYFGTYPGADGIPPGVCVPDPRGGCIRPYHVAKDRNVGGPHAMRNAIRDIDGGAMDGFVREAAAVEGHEDLRAHQRGADVGRRVLLALLDVLPVPVVPDHPLERGLEVAGDGGIGMLVDRDTGGRVRHEHERRGRAVRPVHGFLHFPGDVEELSSAFGPDANLLHRPYPKRDGRNDIT